MTRKKRSLSHLETGPPSSYKALLAQFGSLHFCVDSQHYIDWDRLGSLVLPHLNPSPILLVFSREGQRSQCQGEDIKSLMELVVDRMARAPGFELLNIFEQLLLLKVGIAILICHSVGVQCKC